MTDAHNSAEACVADSPFPEHDGQAVQNLDSDGRLHNLYSIGFVGSPNAQAVIEESGVAVFCGDVSVAVTRREVLL